MKFVPGQISYDFTLDATADGQMRITSPELEDFHVYMGEGTTLPAMLNLMQPALHVYFYLKGLDISRSMIALEAPGKDTPDDGIWQPKQALRCVITPA